MATRRIPLVRIALVFAALLAASSAAAQFAAPRPAFTAGPGAVATGAGPGLVAARAIPGRAVISEADLAIAPTPPGALRDAAEAVGLEARVTLYAGRPIHASDLVQPAVVERNDLVTLSFRRGGLSITAEGRALDRGAIGDPVRAMNLVSRQTVSGRVVGPRLVDVSR